MTLADKIEKRIREIPTYHHGIVSLVPPRLDSLLDDDLIRRIALEAADVAKASLTQDMRKEGEGG